MLQHSRWIFVLGIIIGIVLSGTALELIRSSGQDTVAMAEAAKITNVVVDKVNSAKQGGKLIIHANIDGFNLDAGFIEVVVCVNGDEDAEPVCSAPEIID